MSLKVEMETSVLLLNKKIYQNKRFGLKMSAKSSYLTVAYLLRLFEFNGFQRLYLQLLVISYRRRLLVNYKRMVKTNCQELVMTIKNSIYNQGLQNVGSIDRKNVFIYYNLAVIWFLLLFCYFQVEAFSKRIKATPPPPFVDHVGLIFNNLNVKWWL